MGNCLCTGRRPHRGRRWRGDYLESQERKADARSAPEVDQRPTGSDVKMPARAGDCTPAAASEAGAVRRHMRGSPKATETRQGTGLNVDALRRRRRERPRWSSLERPRKENEFTVNTGKLADADVDNRGGSIAGRPRWLVVKAKRATTRAPTSRSSESNRLRPARPLSDLNVMGGSSKAGVNQSIEPPALRLKL